MVGANKRTGFVTHVAKSPFHLLVHLLEFIGVLFLFDIKILRKAGTGVILLQFFPFHTLHKGVKLLKKQIIINVPRVMCIEINNKSFFFNFLYPFNPGSFAD